MRIIVPHTDLRPETRAALEADGQTPEYHRVGPGTDEAYFNLLHAVWAEGAAFTVVEHDIVVFPGAIADLEACSQPWCGRPYSMGGSMEAALGCTRFSAALVANNPGVVDAIDRLPFDGITKRRHWGRLDTRLAQVLHDQLGLTIHTHWPAVEHLNPDKARLRANCVHCGETIPWATIMAGPAPYSHDCTEEQWIAPPPAPEPHDGTNTILVGLD